MQIAEIDIGDRKGEHKERGDIRTARDTGSSGGDCEKRGESQITEVYTAGTKL